MKTPGSVVITVSPTGFLTEGTVAVITATFTDSTGALADPTNIFLEYAIAPPASPYGTPATITFTGSSAPAVGTCFRLSTGAYQVWLDTTAQPGYWVFDLESTGTCEAESPTGTFVVQPAAY
jgi:type II secretory pathway pseudopilin PulG